MSAAVRPKEAAFRSRLAKTSRPAVVQAQIRPANHNHAFSSGRIVGSAVDLKPEAIALAVDRPVKGVLVDGRKVGGLRAEKSIPGQLTLHVDKWNRSDRIRTP